MTAKLKLFFLLLLFAALAGCSLLEQKKTVASYEKAFSNMPEFTRWAESGFAREVEAASSLPDARTGLYSFAAPYYSRLGNAMSLSSRLLSSVRETADIEGEYSNLRSIQEDVLRDYFNRQGLKVKKYRNGLTRAVLEELRLGDLQAISKPFSIVCYETYTVVKDGVTDLAWMTVLCSSDNNNTPGSFALNQIFLTKEAFNEILLKQNKAFLREMEEPYW